MSTPCEPAGERHVHRVLDADPDVNPDITQHCKHIDCPTCVEREDAFAAAREDRACALALLKSANEETASQLRYHTEQRQRAERLEKKCERLEKECERLRGDDTPCSEPDNLCTVDNPCQAHQHAAREWYAKRAEQAEAALAAAALEFRYPLCRDERCIFGRPEKPLTNSGCLCKARRGEGE